MSETTKHQGFTIKIEQEQEPDIGNPRDATNLGVMLATGHRRYNRLGDEPFSQYIEDWDAFKAALDRFANEGHIRLFPRWLKAYHGATVVLPLWLLDHSGLAMRTGPFMEDPGSWDSGIVGFIFDTAATRETCGTPLDKVEEVLRSEVDLYDKFLQGDVWYAEIEDCQGETYESCGGFLGRESAEEWAKEAIGDKVSGDTVIVVADTETLRCPFCGKDGTVAEVDKGERHNGLGTVSLSPTGEIEHITWLEAQRDFHHSHYECSTAHGGCGRTVSLPSDDITEDWS